MTCVTNIALLLSDIDLQFSIGSLLRSSDMNVVDFQSTTDLDETLSHSSFDVVIIDVNAPGESGFLVAARLRARSMIGIVMLTGRTERRERLLGLSIGVDHYLTQPIDLLELKSKVRNLARRLVTLRLLGGGTELSAPEEVAWTLDKERWNLKAPNGSVIDLSAAEYHALAPILEAPGRPLSRDTINATLGKPRLNADNRSLDVLISRTRRKIETAVGQPFPLRAARGTGYVFTGLAKIEGVAADRR
jgi:DNA-binding response OmpR family regulator